MLFLNSTSNPKSLLSRSFSKRLYSTKTLGHSTTLRNCSTELNQQMRLFLEIPRNIHHAQHSVSEREKCLNQKQSAHVQELSFKTKFFNKVSETNESKNQILVSIENDCKCKRRDTKLLLTFAAGHCTVSGDDSSATVTIQTKIYCKEAAVKRQKKKKTFFLELIF